MQLGETSLTRAQRRLLRLCKAAVARTNLQLNGLRVLTEAASGAYASTPLIAALAGAAEVVAITRNSRWGSVDEVVSNCQRLSRAAGVQERISYVTEHSDDRIKGCHLVTNLGFVRPIDRSLIAKIHPVGSVALMWEPWEYRENEIDLNSLREFDIPIIGTNESHPWVRTLDYLGPTVGRLLLDAEIEVAGSRILLVGADPFGAAVEAWLRSCGAEVLRADLRSWSDLASEAAEKELAFDALVLVEHKNPDPIASDGQKAGLLALARWGAPLIHVCGAVDRSVVNGLGVSMIPDVDVPFGFMAVTTAHAGARPVVDLHAAGLKSAELVVRARLQGLSRLDAVSRSVESGFGLELEIAR